jgi:[ribosomal protein S5]-alanine N-acetyltransferase
MRFPDLATPRLRLIETRAEHADALYSIYSDPEVTFLYPKEPCESLEECRRVLASMASVNHRRGWRWTLVRQPVGGKDGGKNGGGGGEIVGTVGFHDWDRQQREAKLSYELVPAARGQGLASEAVGEALRYGYEQMGLERVLAEIHPDNEPSRRLASRLGFRQVSHSRRYWRGDSLTYLVFERLRDRPQDTARGVAAGST